MFNPQLGDLTIRLSAALETKISGVLDLAHWALIAFIAACVVTSIVALRRS